VYTLSGKDAIVEDIKLTADHTAVNCIEPFSETGTPDDAIPNESRKLFALLCSFFGNKKSSKPIIILE
jgi:hypothetical protein